MSIYDMEKSEWHGTFQRRTEKFLMIIKKDASYAAGLENNWYRWEEETEVCQQEISMRKSGTCRLFDALVNLKKVKLCIKTFGKLKGQIYRNLSSEK